ncbi:hypothetical protein K32_18670 [Kaistia sp. 32K]|uniref:hypothetical protein n=1 Tax=Kaistia sp. 32K TaxID=2795690 RepID=UPI0019165F7A|nr:hypothetical protein [Kaistia sp. 32K]BCP53250.1 hypothetical protein K32_18670 [Kaistia sp. 32K]
MKTVHNERTKLLATALNNLGVAIWATAVLTPTASLLYGTGNATIGAWWLGIAAIWFLLGVALHLLARAILGRLLE